MCISDFIAFQIIPYYTLVMCILLYIILRKESARIATFRTTIIEYPTGKEQSDAYFLRLRAQWNG